MGTKKAKKNHKYTSLLAPKPRGWTLSRMAEDLNISKCNVKRWAIKLELRLYTLITARAIHLCRNKFYYFSTMQKKKIYKAVTDHRIKIAQRKFNKMEEELKMRGYNL